MLKACLDLDFAEKALGTECRPYVGAKHLDGNRSVMLLVVGKVDSGHTASTDLLIEVVAGRESGPQAVQLLHYGGAHGTISPPAPWLVGGSGQPSLSSRA
jgi:hypothetical protein